MFFYQSLLHLFFLMGGNTQSVFVPDSRIVNVVKNKGSLQAILLREDLSANVYDVDVGKDRST